MFLSITKTHNIMKYFLLICLLSFASCRPEPQTRQATIVDVYRTGIALSTVVTVLEMQDGTRRHVHGKYGKEGETISVWVNGNGSITIR